MTIKQQGGIFGRNPTFNDVEVTDLTVDNDASVGGDASVSGELKVTGDAGFGTTSPSKPVHVYSTGNLDHVLIDGPVASRSLGWSTNGSARWNLYATSTAESGSNAGSDLRLATYTDAGGYNGRVMDFYRDTKDVMITSGNLIINTSGKGIDFSATSGTGTSELLDDYEEGTWTPALTFLFGSAGITYTNRYGFYTKVGNKVYVTATIQLSSKGTGSGNAYVNGLPFVSGNFSGNTHAFSLTSISNLTYTGQVGGRVYANAGFMYFDQTTEAGVNSNLTEANFANNTTVVLSGSYFV